MKYAWQVELRAVGLLRIASNIDYYQDVLIWNATLSSSFSYHSSTVLYLLTYAINKAIHLLSPSSPNPPICSFEKKTRTSNSPIVIGLKMYFDCVCVFVSLLFISKNLVPLVITFKLRPLVTVSDIAKSFTRNEKLARVIAYRNMLSRW